MTQQAGEPCSQQQAGTRCIAETLKLWASERCLTTALWPAIAMHARSHKTREAARRAPDAEPDGSVRAPSTRRAPRLAITEGRDIAAMRSCNVAPLSNKRVVGSKTA